MQLVILTSQEFLSGNYYYYHIIDRKLEYKKFKHALVLKLEFTEIELGQWQSAKSTDSCNINVTLLVITFQLTVQFPWIFYNA